MSVARWERLVACHEVEILLVQAQLASAPGPDEKGSRP